MLNLIRKALLLLLISCSFVTINNASNSNFTTLNEIIENVYNESDVYSESPQACGVPHSFSVATTNTGVNVNWTGPDDALSYIVRLTNNLTGQQTFYPVVAENISLPLGPGVYSVHVRSVCLNGQSAYALADDCIIIQDTTLYNIQENLDPKCNCVEVRQTPLCTKKSSTVYAVEDYGKYIVYIKTMNGNFQGDTKARVVLEYTSVFDVDFYSNCGINTPKIETATEAYLEHEDYQIAFNEKGIIVTPFTINERPFLYQCKNSSLRRSSENDYAENVAADDAFELVARPSIVQDQFEIDVTIPVENQSYQLVIHNHLGQMVRELANNQNSNKGKFTERVNISDLPTGHYYVSLITDQKKLTTKIVKIN